MRNVIILGSGPAGLTAALYTARANLQPLVIEGNQPGGQLTLTTMVENFPGFPDGIMGPDLMEAMKAQAAKFGAEFVSGDATTVDFSQHPFRIEVDEDKTYEARSVIIATGASPKMLGLENEWQYMGRGLSTCATCDGFFFKDKKLAVVGGGDSAMEEAIFLTKYASSVTVIHRRDELRASKIMQERAFANEKIDFIWDTVVEDIKGDPMVSSLVLRNRKTNETWEFPVDGLFIAIGHRPNTDIFRGQLEMDEMGYIETVNRTQTSVEGVFVAGDVQDQRYRQAITAAGSGCMAAIDCERWLEMKGYA